MEPTHHRPIHAGVLACAAAFTLAAPTGTLSAEYPTKPLRFLVGFAAGGGTDITARVVGDALTKRLGQTIIIDNRPSAGGVLARSMAKQATPDGYTLLLLSGSQVAGATLVYKDSVDMRRTFDPISRLTSQPYLLTNNPKFPAKDVKEIISYARANPGKMNYGSTGVGSMAHLASALFAYMAKIDMVHVPYKGASPGLLDLMRGQIQFLFASATSSVPHVQAGRLRLVAQSSGERSAQLPNVPTVAEAGLPGFDVTGWYAIVAPKGTPKPIIQKLNREIAEVLKDDAVKKIMAADGADLRHSTPDQLRVLVEAEISRWANLVKETGLKLN
jgi:tripartite-type tricarboxylate transporter receptor subunit TctC